jgi:hypothetical protein
MLAALQIIPNRAPLFPCAQRRHKSIPHARPD